MTKIKREILSDPFTLQQLKDNLGILAAEVDNDAKLTRCLEDGIKATENQTNRNISLTKCTHTIGESKGGQLFYFEADLHSITSVKNNGTDVPYKLKEYESYFTLDVEGGSYEALEVIFQVGYEEAKAPRDYRSACLVKASNLYDHESSNFASGTIVANNKAWENLCNNFTIIRL